MLNRRSLFSLFMILAVLAACSPTEEQSPEPTSALESQEVLPSTASPSAPEATVLLRSFIGTEQGEVATSVIELEDGGFLVAGYDYDDPEDIDEWDALVVRISPDGRQVWRNSTNRSGSEYAWVVRPAGDDRFVVVGTWETENGDTDGYMQLIDADGNEIWQRTYGGDGEEILWAAEPMPDGGFLLAGQTNSEGAGGLDFYLVRTDSEGQELWSQAYGTPVTDRAFGIGLDRDGGALIAGFTGANSSTMNFYFLRINADGRALWHRTIAGDRFDVAHDVLTLPDGGFAISGYTSSYGPGDHDGFLMRLDADGRMLWMKTYGTAHDDRILHVAQMEDGGFALVGYTDWDVTVWRVDPDGALLWSYLDGGFSPDVGKDIIVARDGSIVAVGGNRSENPPFDDIVLLVLGENGVP
jgi:uncharacterized delta-60 repeat protein